MKKKILAIFSSVVLCLAILILSNFFIPIKFINRCKDENLFRYKLGIFKIDSTITNEINYEKIGGISEFLNLRKSKCLEEIELNKYTRIKNKLDSLTLQENWKELNCGLWINNNADIGFKDHKVIGMEGLISVEYYITKLGFNEGEPLNKMIDTTTFRELGNTFYKDKNHIFHFYGMAGGGSFYIFDKADYETFEILGDCYAKDKNHIFEMRSGILENVDYKTFITKVGISGCIAKDKNGYIIWGDRINLKEIDDDQLKKLIEEFDKK